MEEIIKIIVVSATQKNNDYETVTEPEVKVFESSQDFIEQNMNIVFDNMDKILMDDSIIDLLKDEGYIKEQLNDHA